MNKFGEILKKERLARKLSLRQLAKIFDISSSALGNYERGERQPDAELLIKVAEYFNTSVDYILGISTTRKLDTQYLIAHDKEMFEAMRSLELEDQGLILEVVNSVNILFESPLYLKHEFNKDFAKIFANIFRNIAIMNSLVCEHAINKPFSKGMISAKKNNKKKYYPSTVKEYIYNLCLNKKFEIDKSFFNLMELYVAESFKKQKEFCTLIEDNDI